jgi:predicted Zn-dependent protease
MAGFFYNLGRMVGPKVRKANWVFHSLTGSESDAIRAEYAVGHDLAKEFVEQAEMDQEPAILHLLGDLGTRLAGCVKQKERRFWFGGVRGNEINAFALPGGFIFVMRPLLELCRYDPDEVAFILGHEMGHVIKRHAIDRLMASSLIQGGARHLPVGGPLRAPIIHMATALLNQGYAQDDELEADAIGIKLVSAAGFDSQAAIRLFNRLRTIPTEAFTLCPYLSSHPPIDVRVRQIDRASGRA